MNLKIIQALNSSSHPIIQIKQMSSKLFAPPGNAPSLARLAFNRLGFGPRPEDIATFGGFDLTTYVDQQLAVENIDDSICDTYINGLNRADTKDVTMPPLNGTLKQLKTYKIAADAAGSHAEGELQRLLWTATYARALLSKRQLYEAMVDFWTNHLQTNFQNEAKYWEDHHVIRQHAFGNFRELLGASAKSPAMLDFLSNKYSDGNNPNENYARELMELHTMGSYSRVLGADYLKKPNYTEEDVQTTARIMSGWTTIGSPDGEFIFSEGRQWPTHHWLEKKLWLGNDSQYFFPFGGVEQGERLLDILAEHPSTAYFIAFKLCRRFIADAPDQFCPDAIESGAQTFLNSHGDIRATVRAILLHPKFAASWGQKVKRPFEFFISTMRAMGLSAMINFIPNDWSALGNRQFEQFIELQGQVLFQFSAPTGYPDFGVAWWNTNQVFGRWTMANALANKYFGEHDTNKNGTPQTPSAEQATAIHALIGGAGRTATQVVDKLIENFVGRSIDAADRTSLINYLGSNNPNAAINSDTRALRPMIGMIAASPYAQWR
jgi:uncharacterized protein (DUF1800 family)